VANQTKLVIATSLLLVILLITLSVFAYNLTINNTDNNTDATNSKKHTNALHVKNENELKTAINNAPANKPTMIALDKDISLTDSALEIPRDKDIILVSEKKTGFWKLIGADNQPTVWVNGKLTLESIIVTHKDGGVSENGVFVYFGGILIMYDGEICNNIGHGVSNSGSFSMYGGMIYNNTVYGSGGGVYNNGYDFTMYGGEICGNTAHFSGGGVHNYNGKVTLKDGVISGNNAHVGGGVYIHYGSFTMSGGEISCNTAEDKGGGVYNYYWSAFFFSGNGLISNNIASLGSGVCTDGYFSGGSGAISNNTIYNVNSTPSWHG
jgi:hypothetical protein